jgi:hypothetical protein
MCDQDVVLRQTSCRIPAVLFEAWATGDDGGRSLSRAADDLSTEDRPLLLLPADDRRRGSGSGDRSQ